MESLIHAFGIDARLITIQVLNFAVLAGLLTYFLYKPILRLLEERENKIKQGLADAESAREALSGAEMEKKNILSEAQSNAASMEARAEAHAKEKAEVIMREANEAAAERVRQAEARAEAMKAEALKASEAEVAKSAILAAEEILRKG